MSVSFGGDPANPVSLDTADINLDQNLLLAQELADSTIPHKQKARQEFRQTLTTFLEQPYQETAEKILELLRDNLSLMRIIKINDKFPKLLTPLLEPTKEGFQQVFNYKITKAHLFYLDEAEPIEISISYPRNNNSAPVPVITLESYVSEAKANVQISYDDGTASESELPLRRELVTALEEKLKLKSNSK
jgi:hypothetical protein